MTEFESKLSLSIVDVEKVKRRVEKMIGISNCTMSCLEHEADRCWENPGANERYIELSDKMIKLENRLDVLKSISEDVDQLLAKLASLEPQNTKSQA